MDATLHDLGGILLKAIPTLILLLIVHLYLKRMFFGPMRDVLAKRQEATEGAQKSAEMLLAKASEKAEAIEVSLRKAREEIYHGGQAGLEATAENAQSSWFCDKRHTQSVGAAFSLRHPVSRER